MASFSTSLVRVAAAGDLHCQEDQRDQIVEAFAALGQTADLILLAGDLTTHGEPEQVRVLADACRDSTVPVVCVLGNHDWHVNRADEITSILVEAGTCVLDRDHVVCDVAGQQVGIVGLKGFVGGFAGSRLPDFGEPLLRQVYAETSADVAALDQGLKDIAHCPLRIVLLHYAPTGETLEGEPPGIWTMLGSDRLAAPIAEHEPDLVLHGHAHAGSFEGSIGGVPVYNVSVPVMARDFWMFELRGADRAGTPLH